MITEEVKQQTNQYVLEYLKCKSNFDYFCRNYVVLELPGKDVFFKPYDKQLELVHLLQKYHYLLVLKSRQIGISTITQAFVTWLVVFHDNVAVGIISKDGAEATDFARVIRSMVDKLPSWLKPQSGALGRGFAKRTERSFILTNGSKVYASPVNPSAPEKTLRGKAITFLIIDEAAFIRNIETAWTAIVPALSTSQKQAKEMGIPYGIIVLSTPNKTVGVGEWFFKRYSKAISHEDILYPFVIHWKMIPQLASDTDWYQNQCALLDFDEKRIAQELNLKFLPAEGSFFESGTIEKVQNSCQEPIEKIHLYNGEIWKFAKPISDRFYLIGVDTASEFGTDKSAIEVFDYQSLEQVWEYKGKCKVQDFSKVCKIAALEYPGLIVVESNSYGNQVLEELAVSELGHMLYREQRGKNTVYPGLSNNSKTRPLLIDALYSYITQFPEIVKSERLALELTGLVSKQVGQNTRVEADSGCNDDLALAAACCMYVRKYDPPLSIDVRKFSELSAEMSEVVNMNLDKKSTVDFSNKEIMDYVRNSNESLSLIDTLDFFKE